MVIVIKRPTRGSSSDNEWQRVVQQMIASGTTNDNEWQQMKMSDSEWYNEWQKMTMSDSEWQKVVQRVKAAHLLQKKTKMDYCNSFYKENTYTTSRDEWLILESLNRLPLTSTKKVADLNK